MNVKNTILLSLAVLSSTPNATHATATNYAPDTPAYNQVREKLYAKGHSQKHVEQEVAEMRDYFLSEGLSDTQIEQLIRTQASEEISAKNLIVACNNNPKMQETIAEWVEFFHEGIKSESQTNENLFFQAITPTHLYHKMNIEGDVSKAINTGQKEDVQRIQQIQAKLQSYPEIIAYINAVDKLFNVTIQLIQNNPNTTNTQQQITDCTDMFAQVYILEFMEQLAEGSKYIPELEEANA